MLTHAARAAASQLNSATLWPRAARAKGPGQGKVRNITFGGRASVKSREGAACAPGVQAATLPSQQDCISLALRAPLRERCRFTTYRHRFARAAPAPRAKRNDSKNRGRASPVKRERGDLSGFLAARTCASCWLDKRPPEVAEK